MSSEPLFPHVEVYLCGGDGNAFSILNKVSSAMRNAKVDKKDIDAFKAEAMSGDYDHLLRTCMKYVTVDGYEDDLG